MQSRPSSPKSTPARTLATNIALLVCVSVLALAVVELHFRLFYGDPYTYQALDEHNATWIVPDGGGVNRTVTAAYGTNGFKRWGNVSSNKTKVLLLGDSFTEMKYVNNGEEWYAYLERANPDAEFFVYGLGGFGSLQEYQTLDQYADTIKPDVIIWQFHFNDFSNNDYIAERNEYPLQNSGRKPYLENGTIVYRLPLPFAWLRDHSRFAAHVLLPFDHWERRRAVANLTAFDDRVHGNWNQSDIATAASFDGGFDRAFTTTVAIMQMAKARVPNTPIYFFSADSRPAWREATIATEANLTYIPGVSDQIRLAVDRGENPKVINDGHWNLLGNRIVGEYLVNYTAGNNVFVTRP